MQVQVQVQVHCDSLSLSYSLYLFISGSFSSAWWAGDGWVGWVMMEVADGWATWFTDSQMRLTYRTFFENMRCNWKKYVGGYYHFPFL